MMRKILWSLVIAFSALVIVGAGVLMFFVFKGEVFDKPAETPQAALEEEENEQSKGALSGKVICIDPGHGKTARKEKEPIYPGAAEKKATNVSGASGRLMTEEELNLLVGLELKSTLEERGAQVYMTRTAHECDMSNIERAEFANEKGSDLVIRIHADGSESSSLNGASMLLPSPKRENGEYLTPRVVSESRRAGELILTEVTAATGAQNRGLVERPDMTGFNWSKVPVVLLEMGFMSNPEEEAKLAGAEYRTKIVGAIADGTEKYFLTAE